VINSVRKTCEVKHRFHEAFETDGIPPGFPYRQKAGARGRMLLLVMLLPCKCKLGRRAFATRLMVTNITGAAW
jgi:hypothetical protein